jgi:hypothetical protein
MTLGFMEKTPESELCEVICPRSIGRKGTELGDLQGEVSH